MMQARQLLLNWLELQKAEGAMSEDVAGLIWLLAIEVDKRDALEAR